LDFKKSKRYNTTSRCQVSRAKRNICGKVDDWTCTGSEEVVNVKSLRYTVKPLTRG